MISATQNQSRIREPPPCRCQCRCETCPFRKRTVRNETDLNRTGPLHTVLHDHRRIFPVENPSIRTRQHFLEGTEIQSQDAVLQLVKERFHTLQRDHALVDKVRQFYQDACLFVNAHGTFLSRYVPLIQYAPTVQNIEYLIKYI